MSTAELKEILIHQIAGIEDKAFLAAIKTIIDAKSESMVYKTSAEQKLQIAEGLEQYRVGNVVSNEDVEKEIDQWLKER